MIVLNISQLENKELKMAEFTVNFKELAGRYEKEGEKFARGHRLCAGCGAPIAIRHILMAVEPYPTVISNATGCVEVSTTIYPYTSWKVNYIHSAFENAAATISGIESMYKSLKKRGKIDKEIKFIALAGDGGTYDIGFQALSGAMERRHNILYICYNNEAYMNTGIQRSSATPFGASTTTAPAGKAMPGKLQPRKDLTAIIAEHRPDYVAQASVSNPRDLMTKVRKAIEKKGPSFINVLAPCPRGWQHPSELTVEMAQIAVDTCIWPLYEVDEGYHWKVNYIPKEKIPVKSWLEKQGRFKHLFSPRYEGFVEEIQKYVDREWEILLKKAEIFA